MTELIAAAVVALVVVVWVAALVDRARTEACPWCAGRVARGSFRCRHCAGRIYQMAGGGGVVAWKACRYCLEPIDVRAARCPCCAADLAQPFPLPPAAG